MNSRAAGLAAFLALGAALTLAGAWLLWTSFKVYDDEGYVLLSLVNYACGGRLYTEVCSQYGPFFYAWTDALHRILPLDFTTSGARALTLFYWIAAAFCCAWIVDNRTRSLHWAALALAATFAHLWQMTAEPSHPGGLIAFLVAVGAWAGAECIARSRPGSLALLIGAIGGALALTKINVGVFYFAGAGAWLLLQAREDALRRRAPWIVATALFLLPWVLMHSLLHRGAFLIFASLTSVAAVSVVVAAAPSRAAWFPSRQLVALAGAAAAVAGGILAVFFARGGTPAALLEGVILGPLRHPGVYTLSVVWEPTVLGPAAGSLALFFLAAVRRWFARPAFRRGVAVARLVFTVLAVLAWLEYLPFGALRLTMNFALAVLCWLVPPLTDDADAPAQARLRSWLALLTITQTLHAYPVAGSQISWGTFLFVPLLVLAAADAVGALAARQPRWRWLGLAAGLSSVAFATPLLQTGWLRWRTSRPLGLPGAEAMRLPDFLSAQLRALTLNASVHGGRLFSLPGLCSFNLWSGRPPPTAANVTHWFSLLSAAQQDAVAARLADDPRALLIVERRLLSLLASTHVPVRGSLHDFVLREFAPAFSTGEYEFWVKRGRSIAPLSTAQLFTTPDRSAAGFVLQLCVFAPPGARVATIEWVDASYDFATPVLRRFDGTNCQLDLTPLASDGSPVGATTPLHLPGALSAFSRLTLRAAAALQPSLRPGGLLRLRDDHGGLVAEAIFVD